MKKCFFYLLTLILLLTALKGVGQTENYKMGLDALKSDRYHEAMVRFTKVVADEKFEISGKELSMAYAYLAIIRTAYLEKDLLNADFEEVNHKQGQIKLTIEEMARAIKFQDSSSKTYLKESKSTLEKIALDALIVVGDTLYASPLDQSDSNSKYLANFVVSQFGDLDQIITGNWQLYDILGLAHFVLNDKTRAMEYFDKGRSQFSALEIKPNSQLHLQNLILSGHYYFKEINNMEVAYQVSNEGSAYTSHLINQLDDSKISEILSLNKIENKFRQYITRIDNAGE